MLLFENTLLWLLKYKSIPTSEFVELSSPVVAWTEDNFEVTFDYEEEGYINKVTIDTGGTIQAIENQTGYFYNIFYGWKIGCIAGFSTL